MENASMISSAPRRPRGSGTVLASPGEVTAPAAPVPSPVAPTALMSRSPGPRLRLRELRRRGGDLVLARPLHLVVPVFLDVVVQGSLVVPARSGVLLLGRVGGQAVLVVLADVRNDGLRGGQAAGGHGRPDRRRIGGRHAGQRDTGPLVHVR